MTRTYTQTNAVLSVAHSITVSPTSLDDMAASADRSRAAEDENEQDRRHVDSSTPILISFVVEHVNVQKQNFNLLRVRANDSGQWWRRGVPSLSSKFSGGGTRACPSPATAKTKHDLFFTEVVLPPLMKPKPPTPPCWRPPLRELQPPCAAAVHCEPHQELTTLAATTSVSMGFISVVVMVVAVDLAAAAAAAAAAWWGLAGRSKTAEETTPLDSSTKKLKFTKAGMIVPRLDGEENVVLRRYACRRHPIRAAVVKKQVRRREVTLVGRMRSDWKLWVLLLCLPLNLFSAEKFCVLKSAEDCHGRWREMVTVVGTDNPFNGVDVGSSAAPTFVDVDSDGDMDAFVGNEDGNILHFKNTGSVTNPTFVEQTGTDNPFNGVDVGSYAAPTFFDTDGDLDVLIGTGDGNLRYFALTRCTAAPEHRCSRRGKCIFSVFSPSTSSFSSSCQRCVDSAGPQCESCVAGKIEQLYEHDSSLSSSICRINKTHFELGLG